jgi:DNA repair exonuclease SbcCD nuclease subunit
MKICFKSDIHLDFWVGNTNSPSKIREFVSEILKPVEMDVLIIAGDLGHFNFQNALLLDELKKYAKKILITFGNHDLYLVTSEQIEKYENSFNRLNEFKEMIKHIPEVYFLDGELMEINGFKILGAGGWYDFSYEIKHGYSLDYMRKSWEKTMNDSRKIIPKIDPINFSLLEKEKLRRFIRKADIVFTHVPPVYVSCHGDAIMDSFYTFYGYDLLTDNIKYWIFGHCHEPFDFYETHIRFLSSPLGYPFLRTGQREISYLNFKGI